MVIVSVRVPALEKAYHFSLEETAKVSDLIEELAELIAQKERLPFGGRLEEMVLCSLDTGEQCSRECCLADYGVCGGSELILV